MKKGLYLGVAGNMNAILAATLRDHGANNVVPAPEVVSSKRRRRQHVDTVRNTVEIKTEDGPIIVTYRVLGTVNHIGRKMMLEQRRRDQLSRRSAGPLYPLSEKQRAWGRGINDKRIARRAA